MLMIRHAIGSRLFLETAHYSVNPKEDKWVITASVTKNELKNLLDFQEELNLFIVEENQKTWYYSSNADLSVNSKENEITIVADHQTKYPV
ncbi:hypothetical protein [Niallia sp. NCCP-28]|uniref:hypothetical protein n=1 Tax=Niallia sp. NCCP-28 TaxID=2934712 RepID=UPI00208C5AF9|nr:hypothetical protein [Niallia sp. NCCP-28]GKU85206.1 hypothetical protein NCCP28_46020 [Niallia sp. NCCP-28]